MQATGWMYLRSEPGVWTVGHYGPDGRWVAESDHQTAAEAALRCHWLNGGSAAPAEPPGCAQDCDRRK